MDPSSHDDPEDAEAPGSKRLIDSQRKWCAELRQYLDVNRVQQAEREIRGAGGVPLDLSQRQRHLKRLLKAEDRRARRAAEDAPGGWDPSFPRPLETDFERNQDLQTNVVDARTGGPTHKNMGRSKPQFRETRPMVAPIPNGGELRVDPASLGRFTWLDDKVEMEFVIDPRSPGQIVMRGPGDQPMDGNDPGSANDNNEPMGHTSMVPSGLGANATDETDAVVYAGMIRFDRAGRVVAWNNGSGHYEPHPGLARLAGLPMDKFEAWHVNESLAAKKRAIRELLNEHLDDNAVREAVAEAVLRDFEAFKGRGDARGYADTQAKACPATVLQQALKLNPAIAVEAILADIDEKEAVGLGSLLPDMIEARIAALACGIFVDLSNWLIDDFHLGSAEGFLDRIDGELGWPVGGLSQAAAAEQVRDD